MSFHACARSFLLTYAHAEGQDGRDPLDTFAIVGRLGELGGECIVARELYPTSAGFHFHVFVMFERRFRSRKVDVFDVGGYHPNIEPSRKNAVGGFDYATKDGDIVAGGLARPSGESGRKGVDRTADAWGQITAASSPAEFWQLLEELDPKSMVCSFNAVSKFCDWRFREEPVPYCGPDGIFDITEYPDIGLWRDTFLPRGGGGEYPFLWAEQKAFSARGFGRSGVRCHLHTYRPVPLGGPPAGSLRRQLPVRRMLIVQVGESPSSCSDLLEWERQLGLDL